MEYIILIDYLKNEANGMDIMADPAKYRRKFIVSILFDRYRTFNTQTKYRYVYLYDNRFSKLKPWYLFQKVVKECQEILTLSFSRFQVLIPEYPY